MNKENLRLVSLSHSAMSPLGESLLIPGTTLSEARPLLANCVHLSTPYCTQQLPASECHYYAYEPYRVFVVL